MESLNRRRNVRRLSIFTDCIILASVIIVFAFIASQIWNGKESIDEQLALGDIEPYEKNAILINKIYSEFGVKVIYGQESVEDAEKVDATVQEDEYIVTNNLNHIYETLKDYPRAYFKNNNLTIVILNHFSNSNIALASRNSLNQYKIYMSNAKEYYRSLNHEMYHVFEYMLDMDLRKSIEKDWYELNPADFAYDSSLYNLDEKYVYFEGCNLNETYFVSKYSKASSKEDRAEIFAELMVHDTSNQVYFYESEIPIMKKASYVLRLLSYKYGESDKYKWSL